MSKCTFNEKLECDTEYQNAEFRRQLLVALLGGAFWFGGNKNGCQAKPYWCARCQANKKQR